jgi:hypothetical protein
MPFHAVSGTIKHSLVVSGVNIAVGCAFGAI